MGFDPAACRQELAQALDGSEELDALVSQIGVYDPQSIITFGSEAAEQVSKCSNDILCSTNSDGAGDSGPFLSALGRVMEQFDPEEAAGVEKKNSFPFFGKPKKDPDQILAKYRAMGEEVDKVYIELKKYEAEINRFQEKLQALLNANVRCYQMLVKYILAGEQGLREMDAYLVQMGSELVRRAGDLEFQSDYDVMQRARTLLERRLHDLHIVEIVALQSIPMLQTMQRNNESLIEKLHASFLVTLPVFKQALAQVVRRKRQRLQAAAMRALEERTQEQGRRNARSLENAGADPEETLEQTWRTIVSGIGETQSLQADAETQRTADAARLEELRQAIH